MDERLPAHVEASALMRRVQADGGFAAVLHKGDPERGAVSLLLRRRGEFFGLLERVMGPGFAYVWQLSRSDEELSSRGIEDLVASKRRFDADSWLIELDIAEPERFIAEMTS
jgi:hypothetical protein